MECSDDKLAAYIDGVIGPDDKREMESHLAECAECRNIWRFVVAAKGDEQEDEDDGA